MTEDNRRIAEWCGFRWFSYRHKVLRRGWVDGKWLAPRSGHGRHFYNPPDFNKIESHEQWTWPRLRELGYCYGMKVNRAGLHLFEIVSLDWKHRLWLGRDPNPATACNKAILKLMEAK